MNIIIRTLNNSLVILKSTDLLVKYQMMVITCQYTIFAIWIMSKIALTDFKDWSVAYYHPFKGLKICKAPTNWAVIKLLNKLMIGA